MATAGYALAAAIANLPEVEGLSTVQTRRSCFLTRSARIFRIIARG